MKMKSSLLTVSTLLSAAYAQTPVYKDPKAPIDDRVADLLKRMTIEEKTSQLLQGDIRNWLNIDNNKFNASGLAWSTDKRGGSYYVGVAIPPQWINDAVKKAQDYAVTNTSLGIPPWVQTEGIHGLLAINATIFNSPIAQACSFNPELIRKMGAAIAEESKAIGVNQILGPLADLARELRFGRVEETYGEDPYLTGEMAYEYVKGLQGGGVSAMVKHFTAFASPEQGLNTGPVHGGERELRTTYLPPFHRAIIDGEATSIMTSYNSYDGVPVVASHFMLTQILRNEWGYKYFTMSDAGATDRLCFAFKMCEEKPIDKVAVTNYVLPAGNDVEMGGGSYNFEVIPQLVKAGKLDIKIVDTAVERELRAKFKMGLFEKPYLGSPASAFDRHVHTKEHVALARQLDAESIVLLENHNNVLPLKKTANVAVIGPMGHGYINYGDYVVWNSSKRGVSPYDGIKNASTGKVTFTQGAERWSSDQSGFPAAIEAAKAADVAVVVVGTWSRDQNELWQGLNATTGEHVDVHNLNLVGAMPHLVKAIIDTGKPTIVVYSSGKPITEPWISDAASALVQQFYPSEEGGNALADILYGNINPSGKLSVGYPYDVGTTPIYYDYLNSGRTLDAGHEYENGTLKFGHAYVLSDPRPQYEFGYGKSYTTFKFGPLTLSKAKLAVQDRFQATVEVFNTGTRDGAEVVQLYVKDLIASVAVPNIELKAFKKVTIKAGATETIKFDLKVRDFGLWDINMKYVVEPGKFVLYAASSSAQLRSNATLEVM